MDAIERQRVVDSLTVWTDAGALVLPCSVDGSKSPIGKWAGIRDGKKPRPSVENLAHKIMKGETDGLCVICGVCSGNLEMLEADTSDPELLAELYMNIEAAGLASLWERIISGVEERSPSSGLHWYIRTLGPPLGNLKLAYPEPVGDEKADNKATFETRGQGGQVVAAYSAGRTHPTGKPYVFTKGEGPHNIPTITVEERNALYAAVRQCCRQPHRHIPKQKPVYTQQNVDANRIGDQFAAKVTWDEILQPLGYIKGRRYEYDGQTNYEWARPGKAAGTRSVVTTPTNLMPFSSATVLEADDAATGMKRSYTKFTAWVLLQFGNDANAFRKAADYIHQCRAFGRGWPDIASCNKKTQRVTRLPGRQGFIISGSTK